MCAWVRWCAVCHGYLVMRSISLSVSLWECFFNSFNKMLLLTCKKTCNSDGSTSFCTWNPTHIYNQSKHANKQIQCMAYFKIWQRNEDSFRESPNKEVQNWLAKSIELSCKLCFNLKAASSISWGLLVAAMTSKWSESEDPIYYRAMNNSNQCTYTYITAVFTRQCS